MGYDILELIIDEDIPQKMIPVSVSLDLFGTTP